MYNQFASALNPPILKHYNLFISHSWDYGIDRNSLWNLLVQNFTTQESFSDSSAPKDHPIHAMNDQQLVSELFNRIGKIGVLIVPAGVYVTHSKWIQVEMAIAQRLGVPILAVHKYGADRSSTVALQGANHTVHWNGQSITGAIRSLHG